jgi:hypothetical protein
MGRGRMLVAIGSVLAIIGAFLPWTHFGGAEFGLPADTRNAFDGAGVLTFIAGVALLAILLLPYASSSGRSSLDRWVSYVLLAGLMVLGTLLELYQLFSSGAFKPLPPLDVLGMWLGILGTIVVAWGAGEIVGQETSARSSDGPRQMTTFRPRRRR